MSHDGRGGDWSDAAGSQGMSRTDCQEEVQKDSTPSQNDCHASILILFSFSLMWKTTQAAYESHSLCTLLLWENIPHQEQLHIFELPLTKNMVTHCSSL